MMSIEHSETLRVSLATAERIAVRSRRLGFLLGSVFGFGCGWLLKVFLSLSWR